MDRDLRRPYDPRAMEHGPGRVPEKTVGVLWDINSGTPIGTCFAFLTTGLFLTAKHVIEGRSASDLEVHISGVGRLKTGRAWLHPEVDLALIRLRSGEFDKDSIDCFQLAESGLLALSTHVAVFGYALNGKEKQPEARWSEGYVQTILPGPSYEMSYASLPGVSGSPLMPENDRGRVVGVVNQNRNISFRQLSPGGETVCIASYATAVALHPLTDWLTGTGRY